MWEHWCTSDITMPKKNGRRVNWVGSMRNKNVSENDKQVYVLKKQICNETTKKEAFASTMMMIRCWVITWMREKTYYCLPCHARMVSAQFMSLVIKDFVYSFHEARLRREWALDSSFTSLSWEIKTTSQSFERIWGWKKLSIFRQTKTKEIIS